MTRRPERIEFDSAQRELRAVLNSWDPAGLLPAPDSSIPVDEYDRMVPGIYTLLRSGAEETELVEFLESEIREHYGQPAHAKAVSELAQGVLRWWNARAS